MTTDDIPEVIFIKLKYATSVKFIFDKIMYSQIDGIPISSPLSLTLTNIFVGFHKQDLTEHIKGPNYYVTYVNSAFCVFNNKVEAGVFHETLNKLDLALQFICKKEKNGVLSFVDQLIHRLFHQCIRN